MFAIWKKIAQRQFVDVVKITRRVGDDEILEISFNGRAEDTINKADKWLTFLYARMLDHNTRVLAVNETTGGATPDAIIKRVK